jgi:hypothetical protein
MKDEVIKAILGIVKGGVLLVVAGVVFYNVYPKYEYTVKGAYYVRFNQVTGQVEISDMQKDWEDPKDFFKN